MCSTLLSSTEDNNKRGENEYHTVRQQQSFMVYVNNWPGVVLLGATSLTLTESREGRPYRQAKQEDLEEPQTSGAASSPHRRKLSLGFYRTNDQEAVDDDYCLTEDLCDKQRKKLGFTHLYSGNYATKGCFYKKNNAFWGEEGGVAAMTTMDLGGIKERIKCEGWKDDGWETDGWNDGSHKETDKPSKSD